MIETPTFTSCHSKKPCLALDEIAPGNSTYDGVSIAWAVVEYIHNQPHTRSHIVRNTLSRTYPTQWNIARSAQLQRGRG
jgi:hypothetical protein